MTASHPGPVPLAVVVAHPVPLFRRGVQAVVDGLVEFGPVLGVDSLAEVAGLFPAGGDGLCLVASDLGESDLREMSRLRESAPQVRIIAVLSTPRSRADMAAALAAGVAGVIDEQVSFEDLAGTLRGALAGRVTLASGAMAERGPEGATGVRLTRRERQVLELMGQGLGNRAIAAELFISENTVKNHVRRVHEKLQVRTRTEAVVRAAREGIVRISAPAG